MKITAEPKSDQWNAEDFLSGPRTFTVAGVKVGTAEQKYDITLEGEKRVWRPPLTVLRTLIKCWGDDATQWAGKRVTLYCDERVTFGKEAVGGIRVSHVSGIDKPTTVSVTATRGRRTKVTVQPLPDAPSAPAMISREQWEQITTVAEEKGITEPLAWASDQVGRALDGPQQITADEATQLMGSLKEEAQ